MTPPLHYDPLGRLIRTEYPDGTESRVRRALGPQRHGGRHELVHESARPVGDPEPLAAESTNAHHDTPTVTRFDAQARPVVSVAYLGGGTTYSVVADEHQRYSPRMPPYRVLPALALAFACQASERDGTFEGPDDVSDPSAAEADGDDESAAEDDGDPTILGPDRVLLDEVDGGVRVTIEGGTAPLWRFGGFLASTSYRDEACRDADDICHSFGPTGGMLTFGAPAMDGTTDVPQLHWRLGTMTFILSSVTGRCWTWGKDTDFYSSTCTTTSWDTSSFD